MSFKIPLLGRSPINFATAKNTDDNIIALSKQYYDTIGFYETLLDKKDAIQDIVRFQLGLDPYRDKCAVSPYQDWMRGRFNVCVPVTINSRRFCGKVIMRFPLPHMFGGSAGSSSSIIDDKVCCEVGTYHWMQHHCTNVRIPHLHGFGLSNHTHVSRTLTLVSNHDAILN